MYNLYTHEKKTLEKNIKQFQTSLNEETKKKRQEKIKNLSIRYNNRMENFIYTMCENPIILQKSTKEKGDSNTLRNFKLREFITDKQRVKKMELYKNKLKAYDLKRKNIDKKRNINKIKNHTNYILIQPKMRFNNRTKLEKIINKIKKDDIINIEQFGSPLLEHIKKLKFNDVKKVKEFYYLLDKNDLEDVDIQKLIQNINDAEESEKTNRYTLKDYLEWKYHHNILCYKNKKSRDNSLNGSKNSLIQNFGKKPNKTKTKNDYEILRKDDFKTHFKGTSQFIEFLDLNDKNEKTKNKISKKREVSALIFRTKNINDFKNLDRIKSPRNDKNKKNKKMKRVYSVCNFDYYNDKKENLLLNKTDKNNFILKELNEEFRKKKLTMMESMSNEIKLTKSITNEFMQKYNSSNLFTNSSTVNIPKNSVMKNFNDFLNQKNDKGLKEKFANLSAEIEKENRRINNERYKKFVKRFSRSIFGFKSKEMREKVKEMQVENKRDYVVIDDNVYPKTNIKKIANEIFLKCNYYNKKITKI